MAACPRKCASEVKVSVPIVWIIGAPGSGRKTQCKKIVTKYGFKCLSVGDMLRFEVESGSPKGKEYDQLMKEGKMAPTEDVIKLLKKAIKRHTACPCGCGCGFLIDGFPRCKEQGEAFEKQVGPVDLIIYLCGSDETLKKRYIGERERSDECQDDDDEESLQARIACFKQKIPGIIEKYKPKLVTINVDRTPEVIFCDIIPPINCLMQKVCNKVDPSNRKCKCG